MKKLLICLVPCLFSLATSVAYSAPKDDGRQIGTCIAWATELGYQTEMDTLDKYLFNAALESSKLYSETIKDQSAMEKLLYWRGIFVGFGLGVSSIQDVMFRKNGSSEQEKVSMLTKMYKSGCNKYRP